MSNVRYWELKGDPEGRRFCFTVTPWFVCPYAEEIPQWMRSEARLEGLDGELVAELWRRGHRHKGGRARVGGRLTDRCDACGARMDARGYSAYVERDPTAAELTGERATAQRIGERLGFRGPSVRVKGVTGLATRREAKQWAWDEYTIAKRALEEVAAS